MEENHAQQTTTAQLSIDKWKLSTKMVPNYNKFPTHLFKHLLYKAIPCYRHQIHQYLKNPKLLSFTQQYAHLICTILQLQMENDYWKHVINGLLSAVNWLSQMSKDLTRRNSVNWDYPRTQHNIRHRQRLIGNKLQQTTQNLQCHLQQYSFCWSMSNQTLMNRTISQALTVVTRNSLQKLHCRFEEKKILMQFDVYDIYLIKSFSVLNPTEEQKHKVEKIWGVKRKSCQRNIHQIKTKSLENKSSTVQDDTSSMFKGNSALYIDYDYEQDQVSFLESINPLMRTIIETRQANMEKPTQQTIAFQNNTASSSAH